MNPDERDDLEDQWLRDTLADTVSDVEPTTGLDEIRRAADSRSPRRGTLLAGGAGLLVAATVGAIALAGGLWDTEPEATPAAPTPSATGSPEPTEPTPPTESAEEPPAPEPDGSEVASGPVPVYYVGDTGNGDVLFREFRATTVTGDVLDLAVSMAVSADPLDPDYSRPWPEGMDASATYDEGAELIEIDLTSGGHQLRSRPDGYSASLPRVQVQQLVYTAQAAAQRRAPVQFLIDGEATDQLLGEDTSQPIGEADPMQVLAPVWIIDPAEGRRTDGRLHVTGRGAFFEATAVWEVIDRDTGRIERRGSAMAQECCTLSPFEFTLPRLPEGDYTLRVYDEDVSGEQLPVNEDTKSFSIGPVS